MCRQISGDEWHSSARDHRNRPPHPIKAHPNKSHHSKSHPEAIHSHGNRPEDDPSENHSEAIHPNGTHPNELHPNQRNGIDPSKAHLHLATRTHPPTSQFTNKSTSHLRLLRLFVLLIIHCDLVYGQFISANNNLQVNRPLQRWEQFLKLNQLTPTSGNNFANHLSSLNNLNNLDNLFTMNPGVNSPVSPIGIIANSDKPPTVVLSNSLPNGLSNGLTNGLSNGADNQPNSIFISSNTADKFREPGSYLTPSGTLSASPKFNNQDQELRFTTNTAFIDAFKNRTNHDHRPAYDGNGLAYSGGSPGLNSSYSNSVPTRTHLDNFKELNHNLTRNHYIELSKKFMNLTLSITDSQFARFLKFVQELSGSGNFNSDCMSTLISLFYGIRRQQSWALKFIDSTGFLPRGIIDGTFTSLGEYDQCISIQIPGELVKRNKERNPDVYGKYCLSKLHLTKYNLLTAQEKQRFHRQYSSKLRYGANGRLANNADNLTSAWSAVDDRMEDGDDERPAERFGKPTRKGKLDSEKFQYNGTLIQNTVFENVSRLGLEDFFQHIHAFRIGICAPSTCTNSDINIFLNKILNEYKVYAQVSAKCDTVVSYQSSYHSKYTLIAIFVLLSSTAMVCLGTVLDFLRSKQARCGVYPNERLIGKLLRCFSIRTAIYRLTKCNCEHQTELYPIHGLKVLLTVWLIWSSTYLFGVFYSVLWLYKRLIVVKEIPKEFWFQLVSNSWLIADAFFFLSGLLLVYVGSSILSKSRFFFYVIQKTSRLLPPLIGLFCFYSVMLNFAYGPVLLDDTVRRQLIHNCEQNWWKSLLFINNLDDPRSMCLPNTFYLSANVQLTLMFYPLVMIMNQRPKLATNLLWLIVLIGICYSGFVTYDSNLNGMIGSDQLTNLDYINYHLQLTYFSTFQHLTSYCIGLLTGGFILNRPSFLKNANRFVNFLLWTFSIFLSLFAIFMPYFWNDTYPSTVESVLYAAFHRPIFSAGLALLTFLMINGNAKFFARLLCANFFIPLSRLSLATYLVHLPVVYLKFYTSRSTIVWSNLDFLFSTVTIYFLSITFGLLLYVLFQSPIESIEKVLFDDSKGSNDIFNYEQNFKVNNLSTTTITKQCHCGLNSARLAAKVNLDFSSFGLKSQKPHPLNSHALNSHQLNAGGNSPEFSGSSTKSLNDFPDSSNFLVSNVISYNTNGEDHLERDKIDGIMNPALASSAGLSSNHSNHGNQHGNYHHSSSYLATSVKQQASNFTLAKLSDYDDDDVQLPQLEKSSYASYQTDKSYDKEVEITATTARISQMGARSLPGFNNQIGNNVANEIRKRLEQIKQTTNKLNSQSSNYRSGISNIQEEENEDFEFYSTDDNYVRQQPASYLGGRYPNNNNNDKNNFEKEYDKEYDESYHKNMTFKV